MSVCWEGGLGRISCAASCMDDDSCQMWARKLVGSHATSNFGSLSETLQKLHKKHDRILTDAIPERIVWAGSCLHAACVPGCQILLSTQVHTSCCTRTSSRRRLLGSYLASVVHSVLVLLMPRSDDQRMGSLFTRIAREIGDRVEGAIDLRHIFRMPPADAVLLIKASKSVLEHWVLTYMKVRGGSNPCMLFCAAVCVLQCWTTSVIQVMEICALMVLD